MDIGQPSTSTKRASRRVVHAENSDFSDRIRDMLQEESEGDSSDDLEDFADSDDSDGDPNYMPSNDSDSNISEYPEVDDDTDADDALECVLPMNEEDDSEDDGTTTDYYYGKTSRNSTVSGYKWSSQEPPRSVRTPARNIVRGSLPGIKGPARLLGNQPTKKEVWDLLFNDHMICTIVQNTNTKLEQVRRGIGHNTNIANYRNTDNVEINALLGIFLFTSVFKSNDEDVVSLFSKDATGRPIFNATMSVKRYEILSKCLRFDNAQTRIQRKQTDKTAPITEIFNCLIANSQNVYSLSTNVTVDEMLVPFRGRWRYRLFMPQKPKKYGIKIMCLTDSKTSYFYNGYIYSGKDSDGVGLADEEKQFSKPTQCVIRLSNPIQGTNRNITGDNYFSSIELIDELQKRGLTYLGTMRKNKKEIPPQFLASNERAIGSSLYGFNSNKTLVSYVPKKNKSVILISSMHHSKHTDEATGKPEIICDYNHTKCGVDLIDMKCAVYSSNRRTRRWPMAVFYRMVNIASINAYILFLSYNGSPLLTRFKFTKELAEDLIKPHLQRRMQITNLRRDVKDNIQKILGEKEVAVRPQVPDDKMEKRKTCASCPSIKERKTAYKCIRCSKPICLECSRKVCKDCAIDCV